MNAVRFVLRWWAAFALAACLALLGTAILVFEKGLGYAPCHLCLKQRDIYWLTIAAAVLSLLWEALSKLRGAPRLVASVVAILCGLGVFGMIVYEPVTTGGALPWWAIAVVPVATAAAGLFGGKLDTRRFLTLLIFAGFLGETWMATYHAGVELKWWHGPATCTGGGAMDINAIRNLLNGGAVHEPMCDVAVWSFGGLSMAGWNAVAAGILTLVSLAAVLRKPEARRGR
jgi:disulfide bond formation protein DsbB